MLRLELFMLLLFTTDDDKKKGKKKRRKGKKGRKHLIILWNFYLWTLLTGRRASSDDEIKKPQVEIMSSEMPEVNEWL